MRCCCLFLLITLSTLSAYGETFFDEEGNLQNPDGIYLQLGAGSEPDAIGGEVGYFGYQNENVAYVAGLGFLASEKFEDLFVGASLGIRLSVGHVVSPFVGAGVFAGYSKKNVNAEDDDVDNDDDGDVDEDGEEKTVIDDVIASVYPEVGISVMIAPDSLLTLSGRYHMTTEGRNDDFWIVSLGLGFLFP